MAKEWPRKALPDRALTRAESKQAIPRPGAGLNRLEEGEPGACSGARGEPSGSSAPSAERRSPLHAKPPPPRPAHPGVGQTRKTLLGGPSLSVVSSFLPRGGVGGE